MKKDNKQIPAALSSEAIAEELKRLEEKKSFRHAVKTTVGALALIIAGILLAGAIFLPILQVTGNSMSPALNEKDIVVLVKKDELHTGDLCAFYWQNKVLLKRVIGEPGDIVDIDGSGRVQVNGQLLEEDYVDNWNPGDSDITYPCQVPEDSYFVLGDHRETAVDSRRSEIGCVDREQILGKITFRIWPLNRIGIV